MSPILVQTADDYQWLLTHMYMHTCTFLQGKYMLIWPISEGYSKGQITIFTGLLKLASGHLVTGSKSSRCIRRMHREGTCSQTPRCQVKCSLYYPEMLPHFLPFPSHPLVPLCCCVCLHPAQAISFSDKGVKKPTTLGLIFYLSQLISYVPRGWQSRELFGCRVRWVRFLL